MEQDGLDFTRKYSADAHSQDFYRGLALGFR